MRRSGNGSTRWSDREAPEERAAATSARDRHRRKCMQKLHLVAERRSSLAGPPARHGFAKNQNGGPVRCNAWFNLLRRAAAPACRALRTTGVRASTVRSQRLGRLGNLGCPLLLELRCLTYLRAWLSP